MLTPPRRISQRLAPLSACALALLALGQPGCRRRADRSGHPSGNVDPGQVVAKVDDSVITVTDVQERINKQSPFVRARYTSIDRKKEFLDGLVRFEVLANEAERLGYDQDPEVQRVMKQQMISKFMQKEFESKLKVEDVPDADVEKYYSEHPTEFHQKDEVRVSEILAKDKPTADKAYAEARALPKVGPGIVDQKSFRDLVLKYSDDLDSKPRGGDLSFFASDSATYPKAIVEASFRLKDIGDLSPPFKTDKGWVIVRLTQKRPGFSRPLPEVKHQIQQRLFRDLRAKAMDAFVADLKKKSNIEIKEENLGKVEIDTAGLPGAGAPGMGGPGAGGPGAGGPGPGGMPPGMHPSPMSGMSGPAGPPPGASLNRPPALPRPVPPAGQPATGAAAPTTP